MGGEKGGRRGKGKRKKGKTEGEEEERECGRREEGGGLAYKNNAEISQ